MFTLDLNRAIAQEFLALLRLMHTLVQRLP